MSCKGKICDVQHRNPDCRGGRHARELRAVEQERDQLKVRVSEASALMARMDSANADLRRVDTSAA